MSVSTIIESKIRKAWEGTPAVIEIKEISNRSELPKWEDCLKDHMHVGVKRRKNGDLVIVVKHKIEGQFDLNCSIEELKNETLKQLGVFPDVKNMICTQCGEFSTRIDVGHICVDCTNENKEFKKKQKHKESE